MRKTDRLLLEKKSAAVTAALSNIIGARKTQKAALS